MVFETAVLEVLNDLLGDYFENLDTSQLKLGIWGGEVTLQNLILRRSALDDIGPFKVAVGKLGKLTMKIPWTRLYTDPVSLNLQDLYLLVMPSHSITYNDELEEKTATAAKQKKIQRIEEARIREAAKNNGGLKADDDTFTDKMIAQIIKNVQIRIESIHIRYEDVTSNHFRAFSAGVILKNLDIVTTNSDWKPQNTTENGHVVHKLAKLDGFSLYWNSNSRIMNDGKLSTTEILQQLKDFISNDKIAYVLGPIDSEAKLNLVANPERGATPFSLPRMFANIVMKELALGITNHQLQDIMYLVEGLDYMSRSQHYRKYGRPLVPKRIGHSKQWWQFAYRCVVNEEVRRRRLNWGWNHLKQHRVLCKAYAAVYYEKKTMKKVSPEIEAKVARCEKVLDIFNIALIRKQVEVRLARKEGEAVIPEQKKRGWFSWTAWFGNGEVQQASESTSAGIRRKFEEALTPAEKQKLYSAIDYKEDDLPLDYPETFEEYVLHFHLHRLKLIVRDESLKSKVNQILQLNIDDFEASLRTRPVKSGMTVDISLRDLSAIGVTKYGREPPEIVKMDKKAVNMEKLLRLKFENHPLNSTVDRKIVAKAQPLEIVYHAKTVNEIVKCFTLPSAMQISELQAAAISTLEEWKYRWASTLQYMIDQRGEVELDVEMVAPILIVPQDGKIDRNGSVLVINLGAFEVKTQPRSKILSTKLGFEQLKAQSYDKFSITLRDFQVIFALPGENYRSCLGSLEASNACRASDRDDQPLHLLNSSKLVVIIEQSLVQDDPRFEKLNIGASLPLLDISITENRLLKLVTLLVSLPLPQSDPFLDMEIFKIEDIPSINESQAISKLTYTDALTKKSTEIVEFTEMVASIGVECVKVKLTRDRHNKLIPIAALELNRLETKLTSKTFGTGIEAAIGGLSLRVFEHKYPGLVGPMYILKTPMTDGVNSHLLKLNLFSITPNCPVHKAARIKQWIKADIFSLDIILHVQALKKMIEFYDSCMNTISNAMNKEAVDMDSISLSSVKSSSFLQSSAVSRIEATRRAVAKKHTNATDILLQCDAHLDQLTVQLSSESLNLMKIILSNIDANYEQHAKTSSVTLQLKDLNVINLSPYSPYKQLVKVDADKVVYVNVEMNDKVTTGKNDLNRFDMKVKVEAGSPRIIYLGSVIADVLTFLDEIQMAKVTIIEASSTAADLASEIVDQVYSGASRILLDVTLGAPQVILPRNETTGDALLANLGNLTLKSVTDVTIKDEMNINLSDIKLSRIFIIPGSGTIKSEVSVLDPVSVSVKVVRNLSSDSSMKIDGSLKSGFMRVSSEDCITLMNVVNENLLAPFKLEAKRATQGKSITNVVSTAVSTVNSIRTLHPVQEEDDAIRTDLSMSFSIETLSLKLYNKSPDLENGSGLMERDSSTAFADFSIQNIKFALQSISNGDMKVVIILEEISLEDCRPGNRALTNLIRQKHEQDSLMGNSVVRVTYETDGANKSGPSLVINTRSLIVVLCVDYLLQLSDFLLTIVRTPAPKPPKVDLASLHAGSSSEAVWPREMTRNGMDQEGYGKDPVNVRMSFKMAETEIVLVEDLGSVHANSLLLNCEISLTMVSNEEKTNVMGTVRNIKLSTCNFDAQNRHTKIAEVISPMSISVVINLSTSGTQIALNISNIFIRLTAGTLELLLKIFTGITRSSHSAETLVKHANYEDLWGVKEVDGLNLWYLKPDAAVEVGTEQFTHVHNIHSYHLSEVVSNERLILDSFCIIVTFEAGGGANTMPLLLIKSDIDFEMFDWSTKLQITGRMKLEAAYYNTKYGLWEFLIEPIETRHPGKVRYLPWEMQFEVNTTPEQQEEHVETLPYMGVTLQSNEILEMTISKSALDVINALTQEFKAAAKSLISERDVINSPYTVVNNLGIPIKLDLRNSPFVCYRHGVSYEEALLNHGTSVNLGLQESFDMTEHYSSVLREQEGREERLLKINVEEFSLTIKIPLNRAEKRYYPLLVNSEFGEPYGFLCDIAVKDCSKVLTLRGLVQVVNELPIAVDVFAMDEHAGALRMVGTVEVKGSFNVPLSFLYTETCELFFAPRGYRVASLPCTWSVLMKQIKSINYLKSEPLREGRSFHMKVVGEVKQTLFQSTNRKTLASKCCYIYLRPPLVINNLLPVPIGYYTQDDPTVYTADNGSIIAVTNLQVTDAHEFVLKLIIQDYLGYSWTSTIHIQKNTRELSSWEFATPGNNHTMFLGLHKEVVDETKLLLHIYCPFWMVNKTGKDLFYKGDFKEAPTIVRHKKGRDAPIMFSSRGRAFFSKQRALIKCEDSDWSESFSLDVAGSSGTVTCKAPHNEYQVGIEIMLMSWGLTKAIIFSPRFYLISQCSFTICVQEAQKNKSNGNLIELLPRSCHSFWPSLADPYLVALVKGTAQKTKLFRYDHAHHVLLQLANKYGGIYVDVQVTETRTVITFSEYVAGHAPALLVNVTPDCCIEFYEKGGAVERLLIPGFSQYITWDDPMGKRTLEWNPNTLGAKVAVEDKLQADGGGRFQWVDDMYQEKSYFWISFLDGLQRVLLFTADEDLAKYLQAAKESDRIVSEFVIMFHGLGLSLVDGDKGQEIFYMRIASSDIAWQASKSGRRKRFKPLSGTENTRMERAYQYYLNEKDISPNTKSNITLDSGVEVDFATLTIVRPNPSVLRRVFQTGVWIHYKNYPHANLFHAKLYRIQIDNQLPDAIFRTVLAPVDPPKSVSGQNEPLKPFAEVSIMQRITAHSSVTQYKYFKVLIQEFIIRADIGFINAATEVLGKNPTANMEKMTKYYKKDFEAVKTSMQETLSRQIATQGQKHVYDFLHFSPLKIHLSFSMEGSGKLSNNFVNLLHQSLGVPLTKIQDVVFKLACLELQHVVLSGEQLYNELFNHYKAQAIKQLYVLVFGLDVIGNPYGLVVGVTQGVGAFFYEPIQGAIQGPGEFAEGLALGCKSLVGHTVGGAAGALSKITGTLGKGVAALTLDEEFKQKRRETLTKRPHDNVGEAFAQSGKGLVMGFFDGVTGVVTKPIKGAQSGGVEGFFKGLGKGAVGLIARPATGIVDFTSGSLDAVKRATALTVDIRRLRPPRHISTDSVLKPYNRHEAEGKQLRK